MPAKININDYDKYYKRRIKELDQNFEFIRIYKFNDNLYTHDLLLKHNICNDTFIIRLNNFVNSTHCPYCYGSKTNHRVFLEKLKRNRPDDYTEYEVLTEYKRGNIPIKVRHIPCGRVYDITPTALIHTKDKCVCKYNRYTFCHTFDILAKRINEIDSDYELVYVPNPERIHTCKDKVLIKHKTCGNVFETLPHSFIHSGIRCHTCSKCIINKEDSIGVKTIEKWIRKKKLQYYREYTFDDLRSPITNRKLRFDFYIPDMDLFIEYDGKQHTDIYTNNIFTQEKYDRIHLYDSVKNEYCKKKNLNLLRISYKLNKNEIISLLNSIYKSGVYVYVMQDYKRI